MIFQSMASYTCHLWVVCDLELYCEHNQCLPVPLSANTNNLIPHFVGFCIVSFENYSLLEPNCCFIYCIVLTWRKIFLNLFLYMFYHPHVLSCPSDGPIALFGGIISTHASSKRSVEQSLYITSPKNLI
jgi:hypothetical protein